MGLELKALISKLDRDSRKVLEQAATICVSQTHFDVEPEHLVLALLRLRSPIIRALLGRYGIDEEALVGQIETAMGKLKRGNARTPAFSQRVPEMLEAALLSSAAVLESPQITMPTLLLAPLDRDPLRSVLTESLPILEKINVREALELLPELIRADGRTEQVTAKLAPGIPRRPGEPAPSAEEGRGAEGRGGEKALERFTIDLTEMARNGALDVVTGREREIRQLIDVMMRRRQNNPILVGDPGVGKTAIVEGLAQRIAADQVPPALKGMAVRVLDLGLLQAGAGVKGEFEERLKNVIAEVKADANRTVVFIDEAHALIGAGGAAGQGDAANLLKPALARGEFRTIAATTWSEYKRYFEKDAALVRRFQPIKVDEPDLAAATAMLRALAAKLESHHGVRVLDQAISAAVSLSARYIPARQLPDKAVSVLDTACARVAIGRAMQPPVLTDLDQELDALASEAAVLEREPGGADPVRMAEIETRRQAALADRERLAARWQDELAMLGRLDAAATESPAAGSVAALRQELAALQGDQPLVHWCVDARVVADIISEWTGIPVGSMTEGDAEVMRHLGDRLGERIVGQPQAVAAIARVALGHRAGLGEPGRPVGVFLLCGPSGVGKTETARVLAELLYGGEGSLITVNMSEYQEPHTVAKLKGAPPGYVGFGSGGVLTEAVRRRPYSLVLLDEIDKAHPDVLDLFYQVFDQGVLEDGEGVAVDFKNTLILMAGNLAEEELVAGAARLRAKAGSPVELLDSAVEAVGPALRRRFRAAFLGRLAIVPYLPLEEADIRRIVEMRCLQLARRFSDSHRTSLEFTAAAHEEIARRVLDSDTGARMIDQVLNGRVIPDLASALLDGMAGGDELVPMVVDVDSDQRLVTRRIDG